jgi:hypothetical protein
VIKESNVIAFLDMRCEESFIILREYHVGRDDDHILGINTFDDILVEKEGSDICVIDLVDFTLRGEKKLDLAALAVNTVMTACSDMLGKGARVLACEDLDTLDLRIAEV